MHASSSAYCAFRPRLPLSTRQLCVGSIFEAAIFVVQNVKSQDEPMVCRKTKKQGHKHVRFGSVHHSIMLWSVSRFDWI